MKATMVGLNQYLAEWGETAGDGAEARLASIEKRLAALIVPAIAASAPQQAGMARAAYAQYRHERLCAADQAIPAQNRLRSFKLGEFSATLADSGLTKEQALFDHGLCGEARAIITDLGLFYRGVGV